jgi:hypothetical protein
MKLPHSAVSQPSQPLSIVPAKDGNKSPASLVTRFGDAVDVRNRGVLRINRFAGSQMHTTEVTPAVVRLWMDDQCHELSAHEARAMAEQLLAAAAFADTQNGH